jgi:thioredoxin reductase
MNFEATYHKYLIVGAGPGGLQMGYFLQQAGRDYVILEKSQTAGAFFAKHPIHRRLISINKKHNFFPEDEFQWRHDWNSLLSDDPEARFTRYTDELFPHADDLYRYLQDFAARFALNIRYSVAVQQIDRDDRGQFIVQTDRATYRCQILLLGLGTVASKIPSDIEGIELATPYEDLSGDVEPYRNKRVAIIGQGNSAFETAEALSGVAAYVHVLVKRPVRFAWETHFVGDLRAVNNNIFDLYQLKSLHAVLNPRVRKINRLPNGCLQTSHEYDYPKATVPGTLQLTREYDAIIRCTGWRWSVDALFASSCRPASIAEGKFPDLTSTWESANTPNLFFIGGAMQARDRQAASGFIHGFRYNIRTLAKLLEDRFEGRPYPSRKIAPLNWDSLFEWLYGRVSLSAALFQLYGVLCDVLLFSSDLSAVSIREELPLAYVREQLPADRHVITLTLEFGFKKFAESSLTFLGPSDPTNTACAAFLHPVIRYFHGGVEEQFHFGDSLLGRWDRPHERGGAVTSYHAAFQRWIAERLGLELAVEGPLAGAYRPWSAAEIEEWQSRETAAAAVAPCSRPA